MNLKVNQEKCIGCGNCVAITESKVFDFNDDGLAECIAKEIPEDMKEAANDAMSQCPTEAIEKIETKDE